MKVSTKGRYALRLLIDLAQHQNDGFISLKELAERQNISKKYLEQIVPALTRAEILKTNRGFQGGYQLAQPANLITVGAILKLTEGSFAAVPCVEQTACDRAATCPTFPIWKGLHAVISEYLNGISLQDVLDQQPNFSDPTQNIDWWDYCI